MNTSHTPGPWIICEEPFWSRSLVIVGENGKTAIAQASFAGHSDNFAEPKDKEESKANARLISAAPSMLDALVMAKRWMDEDFDTHLTEHDQDVYLATMEAINNAIHQATNL